MGTVDALHVTAIHAPPGIFTRKSAMMKLQETVDELRAEMASTRVAVKLLKERQLMQGQRNGSLQA